MHLLVYRRLANQVSSVKQKFKKSNTIIAQESNLVSRTKSMPRFKSLITRFQNVNLITSKWVEFLVLEMELQPYMALMV
jgi:hypothetical protein